MITFVITLDQTSKLKEDFKLRGYLKSSSKF
jgi:hypothetical protein